MIEAPLRHARQLLTLSVVGYRFLEWWHSPLHAPETRSTPIPPPPHPPMLLPSGSVAPPRPGLCGLCLREPVNPLLENLLAFELHELARAVLAGSYFAFRVLSPCFPPEFTHPLDDDKSSRCTLMAG